MTRYFSYIPPLSVSERKHKQSLPTKKKQETKYPYKWKNAWSAKPKLFNYKYNTKLVKIGRAHV